MKETKQIVLTQNSFFSGVSDDPRQVAPSGFNITKHFDIFTRPFRLIPYRSFEVDTETAVSATDLKQYIVKDFLYASNSSKLYGLGKTGAGLTKILQKAVAESGVWTTPATSEGNGAVKNGTLVEYKDYLWGFQGTTQVWKWGLLSGTPSITNSAGTVGTTFNTVTAVAVNAGGTGYNVNDVLTLTGGSNTATVIVTTVSAGVITGITIVEPGYNYTTGSKATTMNGVGTGATITVSTVGNVSTTILSNANGVVARDDNLYLPYNNMLVRVYPSGTVQDQALKLPTNVKITSLCNYGNYLAIGCSPISIYNGVSKVYLWNLTSPDIQEVIDWGEGELRVLETIEGMLVGVTDRYLNNASGAGRGSMIIQGYSGGVPQVLKEVFTEKLNGIGIPLSKTVKNNRLFFACKIFTNDLGTEYNEGIWSFGRKNSSYPYALSLDYIDENATSGIQAFDSAGNFFFIAYNSDGSVDKTNDVAIYAFTSILETQIFNFGDIANDKRLNNVKVSFRELKINESIVLKYKIDGDLTWTTIGTFSTMGETSKTFLREELNNKDFVSGREFAFRVESTGGAEITELKVEVTFYSVP